MLELFLSSLEDQLGLIVNPPLAPVARMGIISEEITRTAKDNDWAKSVSNGKYKTLRSLIGAIHARRFTLAEIHPTI